MHFGRVRLQIKGKMPEKMLNIAAKRGYYFQNVIQTDKNTIEGEIDVKNYRKLRPVARKARCRFHILERKGPAFLLKNANRERRSFFAVFAVW